MAKCNVSQMQRRWPLEMIRNLSGDPEVLKYKIAVYGGGAIFLTGDGYEVEFAADTQLVSVSEQSQLRSSLQLFQGA